MSAVVLFLHFTLSRASSNKYPIDFIACVARRDGMCFIDDVSAMRGMPIFVLQIEDPLRGSNAIHCYR